MQLLLEYPIWKDIVGFEGLYKVSSLGHILSCERFSRKGKGNGFRKQRILKPYNCFGYSFVDLNKEGIRKPTSVHQTVAQYFVYGWFEGAEVNHKNGIKTCNRASNLEWCTHEENCQHAYNVLNRTRSNEVKVIQIDLNWNFVKEFSSMAKTEADGFSYRRVSECCNGRKKKHRGFRWKYKM